MKRRDLEKLLAEHGYYFIRDAAHCIWGNGTMNIAIPHHKEINIFLAKKIIKQIKLNVNNNIKKVA
jgi:predicted RNA binding protein YcfA (HicA-like mRNA interferase family)